MEAFYCSILLSFPLGYMDKKEVSIKKSPPLKKTVGKFSIQKELLILQRHVLPILT